MFSYAQVEAAMICAFDVRDEAVGALRGRIKNLQKLGLTPSAPGKGKRVTYTASNIYDWGLALSLAEFGLDPSVITKSVSIGSFDGYSKIIKKNENKEVRPENDLFLMYFPSLFSKTRPTDHFPLDFIPVFGSQIFAAVIEAPLSPRLALINVSDLKRRLDRALDLVGNDAGSSPALS